jgi:hypothetical protein
MQPLLELWRNNAAIAHERHTTEAHLQLVKDMDSITSLLWSWRAKPEMQGLPLVEVRADVRELLDYTERAVKDEEILRTPD